MFQRLAILVLCSVCWSKRTDKTYASESDPMACSPLGEYQGSIMRNSFNKPIFAFRGIRYAEPPVGELRFKPAVPVKKHEGVYDATNNPPACPQPPLGNDPMSEDCLFLNVYSTKLPSENNKPKRPVLVFIVAGDFQSYTSGSNWAGPEYLRNQDIVLVTLNSRLGVLGFISTGDKEAPGNLGLKDQVEALKWVKANIEGFGGDPNSVTIYSSGSGGACVNLHLVSPLSRGLFHRAIISSGTYTAMPVGRSLLKLTKRQARDVGCPDNSTSSMVECLKNKPADELGKSLVKLHPGPRGFILWRPVIEEDFGQDRFLTDHPVKLMLEGKFHQVPILIGYLSDEFSDLAIKLVQDDEKLRKFDRNFDKEASKLFSYNHDELRVHSISRALRSFYFGDKKIDNSTLPQLMNLFNDGLVGNGMNKAVKLFAQKSKKRIFFYYFAYRGKYSQFHPMEGPLPEGPVLDDNLIYIFYISTLFPKIEKDDPEFQMVIRITNAIFEFAKYGAPDCNTDINWEPYNLSTQKYKFIGKEDTMKERLHAERFAEWEKLFPLTRYDIVQDSTPPHNRGL